MRTYLLIHGAGHGGWCWERVIPFLERAGHRAIAPDLPGLGSDRTPIAGITLKSYTDKVCGLLDAQPEPVVLVGHSMAGLVITQAAEYRPDKIATLVYLTAFLLPSGATQREVARGDAESSLAGARRFADDKKSVAYAEETVAELFYGDCSPEDVKWAAAKLLPQPVAPLLTPLQTTEGNFGRVPRVYIECSRDRAITLAMQRKMHAALPCGKVITMDTSHSPFLSAPEQLAGHLLEL